MVTASHGRVDPAVLLGLGADAQLDLAGRPSHHDAVDGEHEHDDFESFVVALPELGAADAWAGRLRGVAEAHDILRMKGFAAVAGKPMRLAIQAVGARVSQAYDRAWRPGGGSGGAAGGDWADGVGPGGDRAGSGLMHLLVREVRSLDEDAVAEEPGQTPAPLVVLSFSDADLAGLAGAWSPALPPLRLASLGRLRHPMSVDLYVERVLAEARCVVVRLLGGVDYWRYGVDEVGGGVPGAGDRAGVAAGGCWG